MKVICDTGVISRYLRGEPKYIDLINEIEFKNIVITPIIRIELHRWLSLYKGLSVSERNYFRKIITNLPLIHLNSNISKLAVEISNKDNSLDTPDILIGATAIYHKIPLLTANKKHFKRMKKGIKVL